MHAAAPGVGLLVGDPEGAGLGLALGFVLGSHEGLAVGLAVGVLVVGRGVGRGVHTVCNSRRTSSCRGSISFSHSSGACSAAVVDSRTARRRMRDIRGRIMVGRSDRIEARALIVHLCQVTADVILLVDYISTTMCEQQNKGMC